MTDEGKLLAEEGEDEEEEEEEEEKPFEAGYKAQLNHPHTSLIVCCHLAKTLTVDQWFPGHVGRPVGRSVDQHYQICRFEVVLRQFQSSPDFLSDARKTIIHNRREIT